MKQQEWGIGLGWLVGVLLLVGCSMPPVAPGADQGAGAALTGEVVVFAAASLTDGFTEMGAAFSAAHPGSEVLFSFAGSQQLVQQLSQGAAADVLAAADRQQMDLAVAAGRVAPNSAQIFARNELVVIVPADNPAGVAALADLARPGIKLVLAAEAVPAGAYSRDFLAKASADGALGAAYDEAVLANVVSYEQNVRAVLSKVTLGEADAGIVYSSDVRPDAAGAVQRIEIPAAFNTTALYPIAPVVDTKQPALAAAFVEFVLSEAGQAILARYGFLPVEPKR